MMNVPAFRKSLHVNVVPQEGAVVSHELGEMVLGGNLEQAVVSLIDGKRTADDIADALSDRFPKANVYHALLALEQQSVAYDRADPGNESLPPQWHYLAGDLKKAGQIVRQTVIQVVAIPGLNRTPDVEAFHAYGLATGSGGTFEVVFADDYLEPSLEERNRNALATGRPWMLVKPTGIRPLIGPIFRPGVTACWECLARRLRSRRGIDAYVSTHHATAVAVAEQFDAPTRAIEELAALQVARWVAGAENSSLEGKIVTLDLSSLVTASHPVSRNPECPACGTPRPRVLQQSLKLDNRSRITSVDTGHRVSSAEETFGRYQHLISPVTGIVSEVIPIPTPSDEVIKLCVANHNFALSNESLFFLTNSMQSRSCGKGMTDAQARVGALCEALERYCGAFQGDEVTSRTTLRDLGNRGIHPNDCMLFSERQYLERERWNTAGSGFNVVPVPFQPDQLMDWTPVWSFSARDFRYLPSAYLYYGYSSQGGPLSCWADSNGNAAGNTLEEAIVQGFLELVERDAVAIWWYNRLSRPEVDLSTFHNAYIGRCVDFYARHGRQLWVLDLTTDLGIPVFAAVSRRMNQEPEEIIFGFGAHLDPEVALTRSLVEMNQFLPLVNGPIGPDGQRILAYQDPGAIQWWRTATVSAQPYLLPNMEIRPRCAADYPVLASDDQLVDLMTCVTRAQVLGLETLVLDQTRAEIGLPVAKVIVPGLRHFWARFAPGRLYDLPVRMGWQSRPIDETELNPVAIFV
ncbi:TOMM precursor leader peptide-binding protein [Sinorhizobium medicae]|nr:TOMM precursor leader peptide-binding protein [Sinorhizobium medicae]MDX0913441.1 TOMM precursor leader peptide-binding protein [Sinorhizobium medicae]MDX1116247.1 TOMM precursor leader peptide-binding protein [Sinorhizobium medicae]MQU73993.1 TOMM precursor leader peptide-binding protein [Sinorhizobium medicae]